MTACATAAAVNSCSSDQQQIAMTGLSAGQCLAALSGKERPASACTAVLGVACGSSAWSKTNSLTMQLGCCTYEDSAGNTGALMMVPPRIAKFQHQVAGHGFKFGQKVIKDDLYVLLACEDGSLLKPVRDNKKCRQEVAFYQSVFSATCEERNILALRRFIPEYLGLWRIPGLPDVPFLRISDATYGFHHPCVVDIKIGPLTHSPDASVQKVMKKKAKYPPKDVLGFRIMGFRVYKARKNMYDVYTDTYGLSLGVEDVLRQGFGKFFAKDDVFRFDALRDLIAKLKEIYDWFEHQKQFMFRSSSVLLIYEGCPSNGHVTMDTQINTQSQTLSSSPQTKPIESQEQQTSKQKHQVQPCLCSQYNVHTRVKMIDFEHVYTSCDKDDNYLSGLSSLMWHLYNLAEDTHVEPHDHNTISSNCKT